MIARLRVIVRSIEGNPRTQYKMHQFGMRFWLANAVAVVAVFILAPGIWSRVSVLYLVLVSLYANWSTDAGAMAASDAATDDAITAYAIEEAREGDSGPH